jgi:hypothetical protein
MPWQNSRVDLGLPATQMHNGQPAPVPLAIPPPPMIDEFKKTLWATADKLRASMDAA